MQTADKDVEWKGQAPPEGEGLILLFLRLLARRLGGGGPQAAFQSLVAMNDGSANADGVDWLAAAIR